MHVGTYLVLFLFNQFYNYKIKLNFLNSYEVMIMFQRVKVTRVGK